MHEYLNVLIDDTQSTWELREFRAGFTTAAAPQTASQLRDEYISQTNALAKRAEFANSVKGAFSALGHLAACDAGNEVVTALGKVKDSANDLLMTPPLKGTNQGANEAENIAMGVVADIVRQIETVKQNQQLERAAADLVPATENVAKFWD
jgi:hypothetical protein